MATALQPDTRTRPLRNVGNSCYINACLRALFALPPVRRLYESDHRWCSLTEQARLEDGRYDCDVVLATLFREARSATPGSEAMVPQLLLELCYNGQQSDAGEFLLSQVSDGDECAAPRLASLFRGRARAQAGCSLRGQVRNLHATEEFTSISLAIVTREHRALETLQEALDNHLSWEHVEFWPEARPCRADCVAPLLHSQMRQRLMDCACCSSATAMQNQRKQSGLKKR